MKLLLLLALSLPLFAVQNALPIPNTGYCRIVSVASTAGESGSARVTVEDISKCGINSTTQKYFAAAAVLNGALSDAGNRSTINPYVTSDSDFDGTYRCAKNVSGNSFDVFKGDCTTAIPNNGTHVANTGMVWRVGFYDHKTTPTIWADPGILAGISTSWNVSNLVRDALVARTNAFIATWKPLGYPKGCDPRAQFAALLMQRWYMEGKPTSGAGLDYLDAVKAILANIDQYYPMLAWDNSQVKSLNPESEYFDYRVSTYLVQLAMAIDWAWDELSATTKEKIVAFLLNDLKPHQGGYDFPTSTRLIPGWKTSTGTITCTVDSASVTGSGTNFTAFSVGDAILLAAGSNYGTMGHIAAIASDTALTLTAPVPSYITECGSGKPYRVSRAWDYTTDAGLQHIAKRYGYSSSCGNHLFAVGAAFGCPDYGAGPGASGGVIYGDSIWVNNHTNARAGGELLAAMTLAKRGYARAQLALVERSGVWIHRLLPANLATASGLTANASEGYHPGRNGAAIPMVHAALRQNFTQAPQYVPESWIKKLVLWNIGTPMPGGFPVNWISQESSFPTGFSWNLLPGFAAAWGWPEWPEIADFKGTFPLRTPTYWTQGQMSQLDPGSTFGFIGYRGDITGVTRSNTTLAFDKDGVAHCVATWGATPCQDRVRTSLMSFNGWGTGAAAYWFNLTGASREDHEAQTWEHGLKVAANGRMFMGHDGSSWNGAAGMNTYGTSHTPEHFGTITLNGLTTKTPASPTPSSWSYTTLHSMGGNQYWAAVRADTSNYWTTTPSGPVFRAGVHLKRGTDFAVEMVSIPSTGTWYNHYHLGDDCGSAAANTCVTFSASGGTVVHQPPSGGKLMSKFVYGTPATQTGTDGNGSYTGGFGRTFRVGLSATGGGDLLVVHRTTTNTGESMPTISGRTVGQWTGAQIEGASPKLVMIAKTAQTSMGSVTASHSGAAQFVATGLSAGNYNVKRDGSNVAGCTNIAVGADATLECDGLTAGAITIAAVGAGSTYYASTTGNAANPGTLGSPWTLAYALSSSNTTLQPGDTVYVRGGTYTGRFVSTKAGTSGNVITYRPYQAVGQAPEAVVIDRQILTDGQNAALEVAASGGYVRFIGFRVTNSNTSRRSAFNTSNPTDMRPAGVESFAPGVEIINFTIDNNGTGLAAWSTGATADSSLFYGNVIVGNGWQSADGAQRGHGHGCYMQNQATGTKTLRHNISLWNFNHGCQIYGSGDTGVYIKSFDVDQNTFFENGEPSLQGYDRQLLVGAGQFCSANTVRDNNAWLPVGSSAQTLNLGYLATLFCTTFTATNNYLIGGELRIAKQRAAGANSVFTGNTVYAQVGWEDQAGDGGFSTGWGATIPVGSGTTVSGNTQLSTTPGANRIVVQPNAYESNRGNVIVYNWTGATAATVDVSGFLTPGTAYKVLDTQNWFGSPVATGTYGGGSISIPLTSSTTSPLVGANAGTDFNQPTHTPTQFNAFVVMQDFNPPGGGGPSTGSTVRGGTVRGTIR